MLKNRLKSLREKRNLTKSQVADGIGVNTRAYIAYEYGERDVSTDVLCRLADFYGVSTDYLLGREEPPDSIEMLVKEFGLSKMEELLIRVYFMSEPDVRKNLIAFAEKIVAEKENLEENSSDAEMTAVT